MFVCAARRLGLAFDAASPGVGRGISHLPPRGSSRITQDQQLTRTSNYSISFVEQNEHQEDDGGAKFEVPPPAVPHAPDAATAAAQHPSGNPGYHSYQCG